MGWRGLLFVSLVAPGPAIADAPLSVPDSSYFEGRWSLVDENCQGPGNWTMIAGGNFVSEDLVGTWAWGEGELVLRLDDLAIDEETGEAGGKFRMDGPVIIVDQNRFDYAIAPDVYQLKRCS